MYWRNIGWAATALCLLTGPALAERPDSILAFDWFGHSKPSPTPSTVTSPLKSYPHAPSHLPNADVQEEKARLDALLNNSPQPNAALQTDAPNTPITDLLDIPAKANPSVSASSSPGQQAKKLIPDSSLQTTTPTKRLKREKKHAVLKPSPEKSNSTQANFDQSPATTQPELAADIDAYNKGVELFQVAQGQAEKGNVNGQQALLQEAVKHFRQALTLNPNRVEAQSNIGFVELTLRRYKPAVRAFEQALRIQPRHANTLNGLATVYTLLNQPDKALTTYQTLLNLVPDNSQYWYNQGCVLQKVKRFEEAEKSYQQALSLNAQDQRTLFNLGTLAEARGQVADAIALFTKAKNTGIDTPIGLEAFRRLQALQPEVKPTATSKPVPSSR